MFFKGTTGKLIKIIYFMCHDHESDWYVEIVLLVSVWTLREALYQI